MNHLIRLYPRDWRDRYGDELAQLIDDLRPATRRERAGLALDVLRGAADAHFRQGFAMTVAKRIAFKQAALVAGIVWLALSIEIVLTNVVFPSRDDNDGIAVIVSYLAIFAALVVAGYRANRAGAGRGGPLLAGAITGALIGFFTIGTFALVDNAFLDVVSQQQTKIDGFAHSGASSMRTYINNDLAHAVLIMTVVLGVIGAAFGAVGGALARSVRG